MKTYHLQIDGQPYEVTVAALDSNPVLVTVNGEPLEVWLEDGQADNLRVSPAAPAEQKPVAAAKTRSSPTDKNPSSADSKPATASSHQAAASSHQVLAPIPGVITDLHVKTGQVVNPGESLCSLEAMKMKNVIRGSRPGEIAVIHVNPGQHVSHQQLLMEFAQSNG